MAGKGGNHLESIGKSFECLGRNCGAQMNILSQGCTDRHYSFSIVGEGYGMLHISLTVLVLSSSFCALNPSLICYCRLYIQRHTHLSLHSKNEAQSKEDHMS